MNWYCSECGTEFDDGNGACKICPNCGKHLTAGPPHGYWKGDVFVPLCEHSQDSQPITHKADIPLRIDK